MLIYLTQQYQKLTFLKITTNLIRTVFNYWEAVHNSFTSNFFIGNKYLQLFSLKWQAHCVHSEKIPAKYTSLSNRSSSVSGSFKEIHENEGRSTQLKLHKDFSLRWLSSRMQQKWKGFGSPSLSQLCTRKAAVSACTSAAVTWQQAGRRGGHENPVMCVSTSSHERKGVCSRVKR